MLIFLATCELTWVSISQQLMESTSLLHQEIMPNSNTVEMIRGKSILSFFKKLIKFRVCLGLHCCVWAFSCCSEWGLLLLWNSGSRFSDFRICSSRALELRFSSCGPGLSCPTARDLPGPRIEPMSPALVDRFLTTGPPGKSKHYFLISTMLPTLDMLYIYILDLSFTSAPEYYSFHFSSM